jgi:transposase
VLDVESFPTNEQGYRRLIEWLRALGPVMLVGVEGTGSYGAGLTRSLQQAGLQVVEVDRPNRQARHRAGKSSWARYATRKRRLSEASDEHEERSPRQPRTVFVAVASASIWASVHAAVRQSLAEKRCVASR